jgi:antitoxin VapB
MGIFIKNPEVERKARALAKLTGKSLTATIEQALDDSLARTKPTPGRKRSVAEIEEATERFRKRIGLDRVEVRPMTKADWDALWPTGIPEIDNS